MIFGLILVVAAAIAAVVVTAVVLSKALKDSKKDADENFSCDKPATSPTQSCPVKDANIVKIEWVDGGQPGKEKTVATATQWVNLPKADKWVNGDEIKNTDRLGKRPRMKVTFDKPGGHSFKVKFLVPTGTPAYTATEKNRNSSGFKYTETEKSFTTEADGTKIFDGLDLVVGGGYEFIAEATDAKGKQVKTKKLTTKRLVYFAEAKMRGLASVLSTTAVVEGEFDSHHIKLKKLGDLTIPHQENIGTGDSATLSANVTAAVNGSADHKAKNDHMLIVAYTDHLAVKNANVEVNSGLAVQVGPGKPKVTLAVTANGLRSPHTNKPRNLWHDIVTGEGWFVEAKFHKNDGTVIDIPEAKCAPKGGVNLWKEVEVDVTGLAAATGQIKLKVNVVDRMRGGLALGGANQTCVCTKAWWRTSSDAKQQCTAIHELGHKVGQVSAGNGNSPDKAAKHYAASGHVGNHCYQGCTAGQADYNTSANKTASTCVMFGTVNQKTTFCADCAPCVKKVDLTAGW